MPTTSRRRSTYNYDVAEMTAIKARGGSGKSKRREQIDEESVSVENVARPWQRRRSSSVSSEEQPQGSGKIGNVSSRKTPRSARKERRFEDVVSEEGSSDQDAGGMTEILQRSPQQRLEKRSDKGRGAEAGASDNALPNSRANKNDPRQPRATLNEEAGDDGFVFRAAASSSKESRPKGKQARERNASDQQSSHEGAETIFLPKQDPNVAGPSRTKDGQRVTSNSMKANRRASLLKDGGPAYPHPSIADDDLFRHCSSSLDASERLRHLSSWILERCMQSTLDRASSRKGKAREHSDLLQTGMQKVLRDLSAGKIDTSLQASNGATSSRRKPHPRNEANQKIAADLEDTVSRMEKELSNWKRAEIDMESFSTETSRIEADQGRNDEDDDGLMQALGYSNGDQELDEAQEEQAKTAARALSREAPWLLELNGVTANVRDAVQATAEEAFGLDAAQELSRYVSNRRDGQEQPDQSALSNGESLPRDLLGSALDPRWLDVEYRGDKLLHQAHLLAQLSRLADKYTEAISARGAQAIGELISGDAIKSDVARANGGDGNVQRDIDSGATELSSSDTKDKNLDRILGGLFQMDDGAVRGDAEGLYDADERHSDEGDTSEGDILRAFAGLSKR